MASPSKRRYVHRYGYIVMADAGGYPVVLRRVRLGNCRPLLNMGDGATLFRSWRAADSAIWDTVRWSDWAGHGWAKSEYEIIEVTP